MAHGHKKREERGRVVSGLLTTPVCVYKVYKHLE